MKPNEIGVQSGGRVVLAGGPPRHLRMESFDDLPPLARAALANSSLCVNPESALKVINAYGLQNLPALIKTIEAQSFGPCLRSNLTAKDAAASKTGQLWETTKYMLRARIR